MRKSILMLPAALLLALSVAPAAEAFTLSVVPQNPSVSVGGTIAVDVVASDLLSGGAPSLGAFDLSMRYDSSALSFAGVTFGTALDLFGLGDIQDFDLTSPGLLNAFEVSFDSAADLNSLQPGVFTLFTITFNATAPGAAALGLAANSLSSAEGTALTAAALNGANVEVTAVPLPAAGWLLISGLAALGGFSRRIRAG